MENIRLEHLNFTYPERKEKALNNVCLTIEAGEFITVCGKSGCGKTTLLRLLKTPISPAGTVTGRIMLNGKPLHEYSEREQAEKIGFVMQSPDNQIVTDKVWHEMAFGLESLGLKTDEIRARVSEMASFFGIQTWFHKSTSSLSGGQKQLLNLASVMVMQPSVLILDEPTSQLDPIAAQEFLKNLEKINRELGTTVILSEHRLEDAFAICDRVVVMDKGEIVLFDEPRKVHEALKQKGNDMYMALPTPMRIHGAVENSYPCPLTVREGRAWITEYAKENTIYPERIPKTQEREKSDVIIELKDVYFRYDKDLRDVISGLDMKVKKGELFAILGGNGMGKTTALSLISGINRPQRGKVEINGTEISEICDLYSRILAYLPQNPHSIFVKNTVRADLMEMLSHLKSQEEKNERISYVSQLCRIDMLLDYHPYDLSGGEQQRAALAKVLLKKPEILLLDEPTKGMDAQFKREFSDILDSLKQNGVTIVMISHDIEFCAECADRCALMFDGSIASNGAPREFFAGKNFYTTASNRMARSILPNAILAEDVILACGGTVAEKEKKIYNTKPPEKQVPQRKEKLDVKRVISGTVFIALFAISCVLSLLSTPLIDVSTLRIIAILAIISALFCFFPQKEFKVTEERSPDRKLKKRTIVAAILILLAIPLTIYTGVRFLGDRKYYFISILIILETMLPFAMIFESRRPKAREIVLLSVLCAIAVAGRGAFFALPHFKPVAALVIITGVCLGGESGFLVGAVCAFVSNFFFGQGPWTPWQMFAFGIIGFLSGVLFKKGLLKKTKLSLCIFGFLSTLIIYGGIMNPASIITAQSNVNKEMIFSAYIVGFPLDLIHAISTVIFLWFAAGPMIEKIDKIKTKYGPASKIAGIYCFRRIFVIK